MTAPQLRLALTKSNAYRLSDSALTLLALLHEHGEVTMTAAAATLKVTTSALTGLGDRLEHLGLATRIFSKADRRKVQLEITPRGVLALEDILAAASSKERGTGVPPVLTASSLVPV